VWLCKIERAYAASVVTAGEVVGFYLVILFIPIVEMNCLTMCHYARV
jgi:hypothetical protein